MTPTPRLDPLPAAAPVPVTPASVFADSWRRRLAASATSPPAEAFGLGDGGTLLVVVAHPDDETLAMGAALATLAVQGVGVHVLVATRGEAALDHVADHVAHHAPHPAAHRASDLAVPDLGTRRTAELTAACAALGVAGVGCLDLPDGRLGTRVGVLRAAVRAALDEVSATSVATLWRGDPHPDHRAAATAAVGAAADAGVPTTELGLWSTHWTDPDEVRGPTVLLDLDEVARLRRASALACYRSQTEPLSPHVEAVLPTAVLAWSDEYVVSP